MHLKNAAKIVGAVGVAICIAQSAVAKISTASYVQEGLVACWDGYENAGSSGEHVDTLPNGQWRDTIGDIPFAMSGVTIECDGIVFAGTSSSYGELTSANAASTFNTCASQGTLEIVYVANSTASQMLLQGNSTAGISIGSLEGSAKFICWTGNSKKNYFNLPSGSSWITDTNTVAVTYSSSNPQNFYINSVSGTSAGSDQYWGGPASSIFVGKRNTNNMLFSGKIYAIRLYSQVLTAEQLAANRAVDVKRFIDPPLENGELQVLSLDGVQGETQPAMGITTGYEVGEMVNFSWNGADGLPRRWTVLNCDDGEWKVVKHGYGQRGSLIYMEGGMRIAWDGEKERASPICRWTFDDQTGRNTGSLGADGDLEFSGSVSAANGYLTIPNNQQSFANTAAAVPLSTANGVTVGFWVRNLTRRDAAVFELSPYYGSNAGCFGGWWGADHIWSGAFRAVLGSNSGQSIVQYSLSASQDVMADGQWHFATFVFRKATWPNIEIYLDGQALSDKVSASKYYDYVGDTSNATFADDQRFYLGYYDGKNSAYGDFDEMAIYPQELVKEEVEELYQQERRAGKVVPFVPSAEENLLMVTVRGVVPSEELPTPMLDTFIECEEGEVQSFDFRRQAFTVEGRKRKVALMRWTLYRHVEGEWTADAAGTNRLIEFVHPGGAVKLELEFGVPSTVLYLK